MTRVALEAYAFPETWRSPERGIWLRNEGQDTPLVETLRGAALETWGEG